MRAFKTLNEITKSINFMIVVCFIMKGFWRCFERIIIIFVRFYSHPSWGSVGGFRGQCGTICLNPSPRHPYSFFPGPQREPSAIQPRRTPSVCRLHLGRFTCLLLSPPPLQLRLAPLFLRLRLCPWSLQLANRPWDLHLDLGRSSLMLSRGHLVRRNLSTTSAHRLRGGLHSRRHCLLSHKPHGGPHQCSSIAPPSINASVGHSSGCGLDEELIPWLTSPSSPPWTLLIVLNLPVVHSALELPPGCLYHAFAIP